MSGGSSFTRNANASQLGLLRIKEEELKIKKERPRLRDEKLEIDLELAETRRKLSWELLIHVQDKKKGHLDLTLS